MVQIAQTLGRVGGWTRGRRIEAPSVVANAAFEELRMAVEVQLSAGGATVFEDVGERLVHCEEQVVTDLGGQSDVGKAIRQTHMALHGHPVKELLGILGEIGGQMFERSVGRVDGPHDFIQGAEQFPEGFSDGGCGCVASGGVVPGATDLFAEEGDATELAAHFVVEVTGNAGTFAFECVLVFQGGQALVGTTAFPGAGQGAAGQ